jgi:hypothetical protein
VRIGVAVDTVAGYVEVAWQGSAAVTVWAPAWIAMVRVAASGPDDFLTDQAVWSFDPG